MRQELWIEGQWSRDEFLVRKFEMVVGKPSGDCRQAVEYTGLELRVGLRNKFGSVNTFIRFRPINRL